MKIDETEIIIEDNVAKILYRCGQRYFLQDYIHHIPLREIDREKAWDLLGIVESMRIILRR